MSQTSGSLGKSSTSSNFSSTVVSGETNPTMKDKNLTGAPPRPSSAATSNSAVQANSTSSAATPNSAVQANSTSSAATPNSVVQANNTPSAATSTSVVQAKTLRAKQATTLLNQDLLKAKVGTAKDEPSAAKKPRLLGRANPVNMNAIQALEEETSVASKVKFDAVSFERVVGRVKAVLSSLQAGEVERIEGNTNSVLERLVNKTSGFPRKVFEFCHAFVSLSACQRTKVPQYPTMKQSSYLSTNYAFVRQVGAGKFGQVGEYVDKRRNTKVAIKSVTTDHDSHLFEACTPSTFELVVREVSALKNLSSSGVTPKYVEDFGVLSPTGKLTVYIVMEFIEGQMLKSCENNLSQQNILSVQTAISTLHARGYVHNDAHSKNIIVRNDQTVCIIDLGFARTFEDFKLELKRDNSTAMTKPAYKGDMSALVLRVLTCLGVIDLELGITDDDLAMLQPSLDLLRGVLDEAKRARGVFTPKTFNNLVKRLSVKVNSLSQVELLEATKRALPYFNTKADSTERYKTVLGMVGACYQPNLVVTDLPVKTKDEVRSLFSVLNMSNKAVRCVHPTYGKVAVWRRGGVSRKADLIALKALKDVDQGNVARFVDAFLCDYDALPSEADLNNNAPWWNTLLRTKTNNNQSTKSFAQKAKVETQGSQSETVSKNSEQQTLFVVVQDADGAKVSSLPKEVASTPRRLAKEVLASLHAKNIVVHSPDDLLNDFVWDGQKLFFNYWPHLAYSEDMLKDALMTDVTQIYDNHDDGLDVRTNLIAALLTKNKITVF